MAIRYEFNAQHQDPPPATEPRHLLAIFVTNGFVGDRTYLLPLTSSGFSCNWCVGFHFNRERFDMVQYNDGRSGNAFSYAFDSGTFSRLGVFTSMDVGSGVCTLTITEE